MKVFRTTDSQWSKYNDREIVDIEPLPEGSFDRKEVGAMFTIRFSDNDYIEAFEDEIVEVD